MRKHFDEKHEIAAWLIVVAGIVALFTKTIGEWPAIALTALGLFTLLGRKAFGGVKVGPAGLEIQEKGDDDKP